MKQKHLIDWFVRKRRNYVLYGCEKGKNADKRKIPHIVMELRLNGNHTRRERSIYDG